MEQLMQQAQAAGLSQDEGKSSLGAVLSLLKSNIPNEDFTKISQALPEAEQLASETDADVKSRDNGTGGLLQSAMGMIGSGGGGGTSGGVKNPAQMLALLSSMGIDSKQMMSFLPMVAKFVHEKAGVDISSYLNVPAASSDAMAESGSSASQTDGTGTGSLATQATNLLGRFGK
jgi:hypothetical protein